MNEHYPPLSTRYKGLKAVAARMGVSKQKLARMVVEEGFPVEVVFGRRRWHYEAREHRIRAWWAARETVARDKLKDMPWVRNYMERKEIKR